jgi:nucleoid DNA-binding protein
MKDSSFAQVAGKTARELGVPTRDVRDIVLEFLRQTGTFLMKNGTVRLVGLGRLRLNVRLEQREVLIAGARKKDGTYKRRRRIARKGSMVVSFTKSSRLKRLAKMYLEEMTMEKLGVDEGVNTEQLEKAAAEGCPECGRPVQRHGNVMVCPVHGSEPFERAKNGSTR